MGITSALMSVDLFYGAGMLMNALVDRDTDEQHDSKRQRANASVEVVVASPELELVAVPSGVCSCDGEDRVKTAPVSGRTRCLCYWWARVP